MKDGTGVLREGQAMTDRAMLTTEIERHWCVQALIARSRFWAGWLGFAVGVLVGMVLTALVKG